MLKLAFNKLLLMLLAAIFFILVFVFLQKKVFIGAKKLAHSIDPTNADNIFHSYVNRVGAMVSGNRNFSLGSWVYEVLHE